MNLIFRLLFLVFRKFTRKGLLHPLDVASVRFWALPHDCDFHMHVTNSRYASFCDLARIAAMFDQGVLLNLVRRGYTPIITAQEVVNIRELSPCKRFRVDSRILGWDERTWIFEHEFYQGGILKARVLAKGMFVRGKRSVPFSEVLALAGHSIPSPALPDYASSWHLHTQRLYEEARLRPRV
jgi:acyl-CoA thioesterase FadM